MLHQLIQVLDLIELLPIFLGVTNFRILASCIFLESIQTMALSFSPLFMLLLHLKILILLDFRRLG